MKIIEYDSYSDMSDIAAGIFKQEIINKPDLVIGLATGSTPEGLYKRLVKMYQDKEISFKDVRTFNLDEYYPIARDDSQSYYSFMHKNLFSHVDIDKNNVHIPNGECDDAVQECLVYDNLIEACGGVDLQLLGVGGNGHLAFNEPSDFLIAGTHMTRLDEDTIKANSRFFDYEEQVPTHALTMGMADILKAKKIILLIHGESKNEAYSMLCSDRITTMCPVTLLKLHRDVSVLVQKNTKAL